MMFDIMEKIINKRNTIIAFVFFAYFFYTNHEADIAKAVYCDDIDIQYEQMYKYSIVPIEGEIHDRMGGAYFSVLYYGELSDGQIDALMHDIKNDGFILYSYLEDEIIYYKEKIKIVIYKNMESGKVRILLCENDYKEK